MEGALDSSTPTTTRLSIFGLGYVGAVSTACFAAQGNKVIGVDPMQAKVDAINAGTSPIVEAGLGDMLKQGVADKRIRATTDARNAIMNSDMTFVCVGTPSQEDGGCDLTYLKDASAEIGKALKEKDAYHVVVYRSTVPPGTTTTELLPILERESGKSVGDDFGLCFHPEFLRESTAIEDFLEPPKTVVGAQDARAADLLADLYKGIDEQVIRTTIGAAEMVKYVDNTWHALKVSFANEVGKICQALSVDSHSVMDIFVQDTKLNLSSYYLKPGFAFGGSCLPKDVRGINHLAAKLDIDAPVLGSILDSNRAQIVHTVNLIEETKADIIGFLGITFKAGTDDLRESPVLHVIAELISRGRRVAIYDPNLDLEGSLRHHMQHAKHKTDKTGAMMARLPEMVHDSMESVLDVAETVVVSHPDPKFKQAVIARGDTQNLVDLVRLFDPNGAADKIRSAGMNGHVQKPAKRAELLTVVERWTGGESPSRLRLLLAEDNPASRLVAKAMLEKAGYQVDAVADGRPAVQAAQNNHYDMVLMDISMPDMDGYEATEKIRALAGPRGDVPIIALTAYAAPEQSHTYNGICW